MKTALVAGLALLLTIGMSIGTIRAEEFSEVEYYRKLAEAEREKDSYDEAPPVAGAPCVDPVFRADGCSDEAANILVVAPKYHHSRNSRGSFRAGGDRYRESKGHANGAGVQAIYTRRATRVFSIGVLYEYAFLNIDSGTPLARNGISDAGSEDSRWHTHAIGVLPEFDFGKAGRVTLSAVQEFNRATGNETRWAAGVPDRRELGRAGTDVTALMAWYEKDVELGCGWSLIPYAGWRSQYVKVKNFNDWSTAAASYDDNTWVHLAAGGLKVGYHAGPVGFNLRGGVSYRTSGNRLPVYGSRAVAPGVTHYSHRATLDRAVGSVGAGINFAIAKNASVAADYDGSFGKDTSSHMGTLAFILAF